MPDPLSCLELIPFTPPALPSLHTHPNVLHPHPSYPHRPTRPPFQLLPSHHLAVISAQHQLCWVEEEGEEDLKVRLNKLAHSSPPPSPSPETPKTTTTTSTPTHSHPSLLKSSAPISSFRCPTHTFDECNTCEFETSANSQDISRREVLRGTQVLQLLDYTNGRECGYTACIHASTLKHMQPQPTRTHFRKCHWTKLLHEQGNVLHLFFFLLLCAHSFSFWPTQNLRREAAVCVVCVCGFVTEEEERGCGWRGTGIVPDES